MSIINAAILLTVLALPGEYMAELTVATWNCQGSPFGDAAKEELLDHLIDKDKFHVISLQETGKPSAWGLKDGARGIFKGWHALFCQDPAAFNLRCSVGLLVSPETPIEKMGFVTSMLTYRPLVVASFKGGGGVGSFHAVSSNAAEHDWKQTGQFMLDTFQPTWWVVGGDFNNELLAEEDAPSSSPRIQRTTTSKSIDDAHSTSYPGITHKSGGSMDGFKFGGSVRQFAGSFRIYPPSASGSRISFTGDHQCMGCNFRY